MNCRPEDLLEDPPDGRVEFSGLQISAINFLRSPGSSEDKAQHPKASNLFLPSNICSHPKMFYCSEDQCNISTWSVSWSAGVSWLQNFQRLPCDGCSIFTLWNIVVAVFSASAVLWLQNSQQSQCLQCSIFSICSVMIGVFSASTVWWLQYFHQLKYDCCSIFSICSAMIAGFLQPLQHCVDCRGSVRQEGNWGGR